MSDKDHPILQRPRPEPSDSSSWDRGVPEVPSAPEHPLGAKDASLIGPRLGRGGIEKPMQALAVPEPPVPAVHEHAEHFDVTPVIGETRGS
jgi:hypothetical protein